MTDPMGFDEFLKKACPPLDLEWRRYRRRSARHRVLQRMEDLGLRDYVAYLERLRSDPAEAASLPEVMRVTVSRFFREGRCWRGLGEEVLPRLLEEVTPGRPLHAWSAGCCGGEEPYTLALLWLRQFEPRHRGRSPDILATDIDPPSLERARRGLYARGSLREVPQEILRDWFRTEGDRWELDGRVRRMVLFRCHDLMEDPPPEGMDLVLARYLPFTYFRGRRRRRAAERLWRALRSGGALMIGRKEALGPSENDLFEPWRGSEAIYRRKG